jgi:hypothetical protein
MQLVNEKGKVVIFEKAQNISRNPWMGWTKVFLDNFCTRKE